MRTAPRRTGYTVHTGSNEKFASGWDQVFAGKKPTARKTGASAPRKKTAKKSAKKGSAGGGKKSAGKRSQ